MGSEARTRLGLAALLFATLLSFGQVFGASDYIGPSVLGMALATGVAMLCRRFGIGPLLTMWIEVAALGWYLAIVFRAGKMFYGLPTPKALGGIWSAVGRAAEASRLDFAPVPVRPGYVVMAVVGMWMCAALGELATFRWRRPLLASVAPVGLFASMLIVGTGSLATMLVTFFIAGLLTYWGLESSHRLRSWGRWMTAWTSSQGVEGDSITGRVGRRMGVVCVAAALVSPLFLPSLGSGLLSWRSGFGVGDGPGGGRGGGGNAIDPSVALRPNLIEQKDTPFFRVRSPESAYWRLVSLEQYASGFTFEQVENPDLLPLEGGTIDYPLERQNVAVDEVVQQFDLTALDGPYLPTAERPVQIDLERDEAEPFLAVNASTGHVVFQGGTVRGLTYEVTSRIPALSYDDLVEARVGDLGPLYTEHPPLAPEVEALRDEWTAAADTPYEQLVAIQNRFQGAAFTYSLRPPALRTEDPLAEFLLQTRTGYCQQFSSAFALLARSLGFPTRLSVGFLPGVPSTGDPSINVVYGNQAHAWPEVFFEDIGWVAFEPTKRVISPPPSYTLNPVATGGLDGLVPGDVAGQAGRIGREVENIPEGFFPPEQSLNVPGGSVRAARDDYAWEETFATISTVVLLALIAFLVAVPALKEARVRRRYLRARTPSSMAAAAFAHFVDEASELAAKRSSAESAVAYARRLGDTGEAPEEPALRLAMLYEAAEYSVAGITDGQAKEARHLVKRLRSGLWSRASWWRRAARLFSPAGLRPARAR